MKENIYIYNWHQACFYIENGLKPIQKPEYNDRTNGIYFVFNREASKPYFDKWCKRNDEYKKNNNIG